MNEEHYISSGYDESIKRISEFLRLAQEARMQLGDGQNEDQDAKTYKEALDGIFIELSPIMNKEQFEQHEHWRKLTDKFRFVYADQVGSPKYEEGWYDDLRNWHFILMKAFQESGMNFPVSSYK